MIAVQKVDKNCNTTKIENIAKKVSLREESTFYHIIM